MQVIRDDIDFEAWMVEPDHKQKVRAASSYVEELIQRMTLPEEANGTMLPWRKTTSQFRLRKNEVTLWPGINGHGKSLIIGPPFGGAWRPARTSWRARAWSSCETSSDPRKSSPQLPQLHAPGPCWARVQRAKPWTCWLALCYGNPRSGAARDRGNSRRVLRRIASRAAPAGGGE